MNTNSTVKASYYLSYVLHPLVLIAISSLIIGARLHQSTLLGLRDTSIFTACLLPGVVYMARLKKQQGDTLAYHKLILPIILVGNITAIVVLALLGAPAAVAKILVAAFIVGIGITVINRFYNISFHAAMPMSCAAFLVPLAPIPAALVGALAIIVGLARIPLGKHSLAQVIIGWCYGFGFTSLLVVLLVHP